LGSDDYHGLDLAYSSIFLGELVSSLDWGLEILDYSLSSLPLCPLRLCGKKNKSSSQIKYLGLFTTT
jgi:hypothetical protein